MSIKGIGKYFIMILLVILGIFIVKKVTAKFNIPVLSTITAEV